MPALSVIDNTPRDCPSPFCGAEADTSILAPGEAATMPLGRNSKGAVVAATMMATYMGGTGKPDFFTPAYYHLRWGSSWGPAPKHRITPSSRSISSISTGPVFAARISLDGQQRINRHVFLVLLVHITHILTLSFHSKQHCPRSPRGRNPLPSCCHLDGC